MAGCKKYRLKDTDYVVNISQSNGKMGEIWSVSLPRGVSCPKNVPCRQRCSANLMESRPSVSKTLWENYRCLIEHPMWYWLSIEDAARQRTYFRWHVCGDIPSKEYFIHMCTVAEKTPNCRHLAFTKAFQYVLDYLDEGRKIPVNLVVVLSVWDEWIPRNPYHLPEAYVDFDGAHIPEEVLEKARKCRHSCETCNCMEDSCWYAKRGEYILLNPSGTKPDVTNPMDVLYKKYQDLMRKEEDV